MNIVHNTIRNCRAGVGTWVYYDNASPHLESNIFDNVTAWIYGHHVASYPVRVALINHSTFEKAREGSNLDPVSTSLS